MFTIQGYTPSPCSLDLSRWQRCYKSYGSFNVYLASEVQDKRSNAPILGQKLATKVSKSRAIPLYVPMINPPGRSKISAFKSQLVKPTVKWFRAIPTSLSYCVFIAPFCHVQLHSVQLRLLRKRPSGSFNWSFCLDELKISM